MQTLADIDFAALTQRPFHPSPAAWEDQVFYFFLLDRFSDGNEAGYRDNTGKLALGGTTPLLQAADHGNAVGSEADAATWRDAGARFVGGTLRGAASKIGYLKRLGVSAIWISPVFKQPPWSDAYHGYGVQDFLAIDPRFGSREDLRELVATAHAQGIHVILDVILNHAGPVFTYAADRYPTGHGMDPRWDGRPYPVAGWNDAIGEPGLPYGQPVADPNAAIWPRELQASDNFSRLGRINNCYYGRNRVLTARAATTATSARRPSVHAAVTALMKTSRSMSSLRVCSPCAGSTWRCAAVASTCAQFPATAGILASRT